MFPKPPPSPRNYYLQYTWLPVMRYTHLCVYIYTQHRFGSSSFVMVCRVYRGGRVPGKRVRHDAENFYRPKILGGNTLFLINIKKKKRVRVTFCNLGRRRRAHRIHYVLLLRVHVSYVHQQNYTYILMFQCTRLELIHIYYYFYSKNLYFCTEFCRIDKDEIVY